MADKPKVVAEVESREVTIDQRSGVDDFETQDDANTLADRMTPRLKALVQQCDAPIPASMPLPRAKQ